MGISNNSANSSTTTAGVNSLHLAIKGKEAGENPKAWGQAWQLATVYSSGVGVVGTVNVSKRGNCYAALKFSRFQWTQINWLVGGQTQTPTTESWDLWSQGMEEVRLFLSLGEDMEDSILEWDGGACLSFDPDGLSYEKPSEFERRDGTLVTYLPYAGSAKLTAAEMPKSVKRQVPMGFAEAHRASLKPVGARLTMADFAIQVKQEALSLAAVRGGNKAYKEFLQRALEKAEMGVTPTAELDLLRRMADSPNHKFGPTQLQNCEAQIEEALASSVVEESLQREVSDEDIEALKGAEIIEDINALDDLF